MPKESVGKSDGKIHDDEACMRDRAEKWEKERIEKRRVTTTNVISIIAILSPPCIGLVLGGGIGAIIGLIVGVILYRFLVPYDNNVL